MLPVIIRLSTCLTALKRKGWQMIFSTIQRHIGESILIRCSTTALAQMLETSGCVGRRNSQQHAFGPSCSAHTLSRQRHKCRLQLREIRRAQPRNWVPARRRAETRSAATLVPADGDIVHSRRIGVEDWVDEADSRFAGIHTCLIDQREHGA